MILAIFFITFFLTWIFWITVRDVLFPGYIFNATWCVVSILYFFNWGNLYVVNETTYGVILLGIIFCNIPFLVSVAKRGKKYSVYPQIRSKLLLTINREKILTFFQIILLFMMVPYTLKIVKASDGAGLAVMRQLVAANADNLMSYWERQIYIYFGVYPGISAQMILSTLFLFKGNAKIRNRIIHILMGVILVGLRVYTDGGRMAICDTLICFILAGFFTIDWNTRRLNYLQKNKQKSIKKKLVIILVIAVVLCIYISIRRSANSSSPISYALGMAARYFTIGPRLLEKALESPNNFGLNTMSFGGIFIGGLWEFIRLPLAILGIQLPSFFTIAQQEMGNFYVVGNGITANAFPTMFYYFLKDFGAVGIFLESTVFAGLAVLFYRKASVSKKLVGYVLYYLVCIVIIYSMCWWPLYRIEYFATVIWVMIIAKLAQISFERGEGS